MIPFGNETVTLIRRIKGTDEHGRTAISYRKYLLTNCSWRRTSRTYLSENAVVYQEGTVCRVPAGQQKPQVGDLMICGNAANDVESNGDYQRLIEQYRGSDGAFTVAAVSDNTRDGFPLKHYAARG